VWESNPPSPYRGPDSFEDWSGHQARSAPGLAFHRDEVDLDARIPPALYLAVAELLAWLASVDRAARQPVLQE